MPCTATTRPGSSEGFLGYEGPASTNVPLIGPYQIPDTDDYEHSSYLPPADPSRWQHVADYVRQAFLDEQLNPGVPFPFPVKGSSRRREISL